MGSTHRFLNEPKFVCACLFLLVGQTIASIKSVEDVANTELNAPVGNQIEAQTSSQIDRIPASRDSSSGDIVIESFDEGLLSVSSAKSSNNRHHYEPPAVADQQLHHQQQQQQPPPPPPPQDQQVQQVAPNPSIPAPVSSANLQESSAPLNSKPEPRNHQEDSQIESLIIDHRPSGALEQGSSGSSQVMTATNAATTGATGADYAHQPGGQHNLQQQQPQQQQQQQQPPAGASQQPVGAQTTSTTSHQAQGNQQQIMSNQPIGGWYSATNTYQSAAQPQAQAQQQFNQQPVGGNYGGANMVGQVQHPTSINSIINEQQNQGQLSNMAMAQPQVAASSQQSTTMSSSPSAGQAQVMSLNGQPMYLVNPGSQGAFGGRRISISNWLKGISNMLASIFNRREHGNQLMSGQASSPTGHWIQLGPNAPHWLTQAQSLIQQQQQQLIGAASTGRYPTYVQAPPTMINQQQQQQQLPMSVSNVQPSSIMSGQVQHQVMPASYNPVMIGASGGSASSQNNLVGDLQASSSSNNYVAVQHLPSQQQFSTHANGLAQYPADTASGSQAGASSRSSGFVQSQSNQSQLVQASPAGRQVTTAANVEQQQSRQSSSPISTGQLNSSSSNNNNNNTSNTKNNNNNNSGSGAQSSVAWSPAAPPPQSSANAATAQNQARFSRSSASSLASASQNLPLAHYSRYAISSE